jgi:hypothetical protein
MEHREPGAGTWFLLLLVIGSLDAWPVVLAVGPEPKGGTASASTARRTPRRCPDLSCVERHADHVSRELLTKRTVPAPQSWRR